MRIFFAYIKLFLVWSAWCLSSIWWWKTTDVLMDMEAMLQQIPSTFAYLGLFAASMILKLAPILGVGFYCTKLVDRLGKGVLPDDHAVFHNTKEFRSFCRPLLKKGAVAIVIALFMVAFLGPRTKINPRGFEETLGIDLAETTKGDQGQGEQLLDQKKRGVPAQAPEPL